MPEIYLSIQSLGAYSSQGSFRCMYAFARPPGQCEVPVHTSHESCDVSSTAAHESGTPALGARRFTTRRLVPTSGPHRHHGVFPSVRVRGRIGASCRAISVSKAGRTTTLTGVPGLSIRWWSLTRCAMFPQHLYSISTESASGLRIGASGCRDGRSADET